ncbi:saccharopine dehydrogenase-like oxidoreductase [Camelus ferus]|uniref:Saccharopine dehydrogenase-like oxidoreductase n=1 Tax=Camelus ferus TaxID=419612 RepID=A0A8B8U8K3_CAMFR|nr:saccharopine dehydrogenase-like oxidoreductase [Camelus ferus]
MTEQVSRSGPPTCRGPRGPLPGEAAASAGEVAVKPGRPILSSEVGIIICDITSLASLDEMATPATVVLNCVGQELEEKKAGFKRKMILILDMLKLRCLLDIFELRQEMHTK